jgi:hypothetical protein
MLNYRQIKARLDEARTFYVPFASNASNRPLGHRIAQEWVWFLVKYRRRSRLFEGYIMHGDNITEIFNLPYMRTGVERLDSWISGARKEFRSGKVRFFLDCKLVTSQQRKKHWATASKNDAQIQAESHRTRVSIFSRNFNVADARAGLRLAMATFFDAMRSHRLRFVVINYESTIGFAKGEPTHLVKYDLNYSIPEAHCYPITRSEAAGLKQTSLSDHGFEIQLD